MLFTISMWVLIAVLATWVLSICAVFLFSPDADSVSAIFFLGFVVSILPALLFFGTWVNHADDLSKIQAQEEIIRVQRERADRLSERLSSFEYPSGALLNADTPVGAVVAELSRAESALARAETERATAIRSVEARRIGPFSGVINFVGDYQHD